MEKNPTKLRYGWGDAFKKLHVAGGDELLIVDVFEDEDLVFSLDDNIFAVIGCKNSEEMLEKSKLVIKIEKQIKAMNITKIEAAKVMGISLTKLNKIISGEFRYVYKDELINYLENLNSC